MIDKIKNIKFGNAAYAVLLAVLGLCFLTFSTSSVTITVVIGILTVLLGGVSLALTILEPQRNRAFVIKIIFASLCIVCGATVAILNDKVFSLILFLMCITTATDGAFKLNLSLSCKKHEVGGWWIIAIPSAAIVLSAFILAGFTPDSNTASAAWLGVTLIALAALNVASAAWASKCKTAEKAEIYYEVYRDLKDSEEN
jgi:uncharacterized membrane protein HdeD (DUF308 family)